MGGCPCNICCIAFSITPKPPCIYSSVAHIALIAKAADTISVTSTLSEYLQWDNLQQVQCCAESNAISGLVSDTSTSGTALRIRWTEQSSDLCSTTQRQQRYASQPGQDGQNSIESDYVVQQHALTKKGSGQDEERDVPWLSQKQHVWNITVWFFKHSMRSVGLCGQ